MKKVAKCMTLIRGNLVEFCFVSSLNFIYPGRLPSDLALNCFVGKNQHEIYKSVAPGLSLASLEYSLVRAEKHTGELLFVVLFF